jgi:hypothetical protein
VQRAVFATAPSSHINAAPYFKTNREVPVESMRRQLVWAERTNFQGWCCTACAWVFNPSWPLVGNSIDEMTENFGEQRDKEFAAHICAEHPRATKDPH